MFSLTDTGLPYWPPKSSYRSQSIFTYKSRPSMCWTEVDLYNTKRAVKNAYRDLILNY